MNTPQNEPAQRQKTNAKKRRGFVNRSTLAKRVAGTGKIPVGWSVDGALAAFKANTRGVFL